MANHPQSHYPNIGIIGEDLVAQWLLSQGWAILHRRWRCRWGEIDIIVEDNPQDLAQPTLAFVEVKTRSSSNWDAGGRSAIALKKQTKLWHTAELFLARYPQKADHTCRFDVAIVHCQRKSQQPLEINSHQQSLASSSKAEYLFTLQEYILAAFDCG